MKSLENTSGLENFNVYLGRIIKSKRVFNNLTSQQVADEIHISRQYYEKRENGTLSFKSEELKTLFEFLKFNESEIGEIFLR